MEKRDARFIIHSTVLAQVMGWPRRSDADTKMTSNDDWDSRLYYGLTTPGPRMIPYPREEIAHWTERSMFSTRLTHDTTQEVVFIKGYCLRCNEGDYEHCRCFPTDLFEINPRDLNFENEEPPIEIFLGNCDDCYSCGTLGYQCLACHRGTYKAFTFTLCNDRRMADPFWFGEFHHRPHVHWIVPLSGDQPEEQSHDASLRVHLDAIDSVQFGLFLAPRFMRYLRNTQHVETDRVDFYVGGLILESIALASEEDEEPAPDSP